MNVCFCAILQTREEAGVPTRNTSLAKLTVSGRRQTAAPAALYSFKYLKHVPGSCQAGRCQAYAGVFHACADRFVYIITG